MNISVFIEFYRKGHLMVAFLLFLLLPLVRIDFHHFFGERLIAAHGAALLFLLLYLWKKRGEISFMPVSIFDILVGSFYLFYGLSLFLAESPRGGVVPALLEFSFVPLYIYFRVLSTQLREGGEVKAFLFIVLAGSTIMASWGLLQYFFGLDVTPQLRQLFASHHFPLIASMGNPNFLSEYLLLSLPLSLAAGFFMKRFYLFGILFFLQGLCIYLTYSRLAWAVLLGVILLSLFISREKRRPLVILYLLFAVTALGIFSLHQSRGTSQAERVVKNITAQSPFEERREMYHIVFSMAGDSGFFGRGPGAFGRHYPRYRSMTEKKLGTASPERDVTELKHAHSDLAEIAFDHGYGAALIYFLLLLLGAAAGVRFFLQKRGEPVAPLGLVPLVALPFTLWSFPFYLPFSKMIILFSLSFLGNQRFKLPAKVPLKALTALLLTGGILVFSFQGRYLYSLFYYNKGIDLFETNMEKSRRALERSIELFPCEGDAWFSLGTLLLKGGYREGIECLEHSLAFFADGEVYLALARGHRDFNGIEESLHYYRRYLELLPFEEEIRREMRELEIFHDAQRK